ncbi:16S rRNA (cytidine(1402)-2'-O)-methyltransferase [Rhodopila sp.]|uniref:16S rRNA (cytidine(1402)-2'-O)-methyltransferase n=1 Tax=Rhodopila sp. TaxID=2480087 RepID=UPI003D0E2193
MPVAASAASPADLRDGQSDSLSGLVLVSTPIGNLGDVTERARTTLQLCDLVLCEDTRRTGMLLSALGIRARTEALHDHNEDVRIPEILDRLRRGQTVGLVSDAGTPLVSDPGYRLVRAVIESRIAVTAVPGPNAAVTALTLSGLPPLPFMFLGFPPPKKAARRAMFSGLRAAERAGLDATLIWHEAPHRLLETLTDLRDIFGNRSSAVARELTKRFETVERGRLDKLSACFERQAPKGELTVVLGPPEDKDPENLDERLRDALASQTVKDAAAMVSTATGLPKRLVYSRALELMNEVSKTSEW